METVRKSIVVKRSGRISISNLPFKRGQRVEMIMSPEQESDKKFITGKELAQSEIVGLWKKRRIKDSVKYSQMLRREAERRLAYFNHSKEQSRMAFK